jgi:hypothetical protein
MESGKPLLDNFVVGEGKDEPIEHGEVHKLISIQVDSSI